MAEFRWITESLFLTLLLHFAGAADIQFDRSVTVRDGDKVALPCENVMRGSKNCDTTTWLFSNARLSAVVELVAHGRIGQSAGDKTDRLKIAANCSLVIKKVRVEDVGRYTCRQYGESGKQQGSDSWVYLSVVTMTQHNYSDVPTLTCSVSTHGRCSHTVKWLYNSEEVGGDIQDVTTPQSSCSASVTFLTLSAFYKSRFESFQCAVTHGAQKQQVFSFRRRPSDKKPGKDTTPTTKPTTTATTAKLPRLTQNIIEAGATTTATVTRDALTKPKVWWRFIIVSVCLSALIMSAVTVRMRTKGNKTRRDKNTEHNDEDEGKVIYENNGEPSASVRLH